ncbi:hypothetical protein Hypma_001262 [Hypsizygus marmoreus]|uniref:HNH nuclease domain-containing protein n=1 Tax=Hypsizygus marmoreus TaxID=39966 RepID=A0A369J639_HYPMA|nr:hypothetical protein Hypma_001262 [Hypsizygus marmoreus]
MSDTTPVTQSQSPAPPEESNVGSSLSRTSPEPSFHLSVTRTWGNRTLPVNSAAWRALRAQILARDNRTCASCGYASPHGRAMKIDHKDGNASNNDPANLRVHCPPCETLRHCGLAGVNGWVMIARSDMDQLEILRRTREIFEGSGRIPGFLEIDPLATSVDMHTVDFANILLETDWEALPEEMRSLKGFFTEKASELFSDTMPLAKGRQVETVDDSDVSDRRAKEIRDIETSLPWVRYSPEAHESLKKFFRAYPPSTTEQSKIAWICIDNPRAQEGRTEGDVAALCRGWDEICANSEASISELDKLAHRFGVLSGKWLIFPPRGIVDDVWARIARATHAGTLGSSAKVSPRNDIGSHVICVFTDDYTDYDEVRRVRDSLNRLGHKQPIGYKPDVYTYCDVYKGNRWNIPPTRYRL